MSSLYVPFFDLKSKSIYFVSDTTSFPGGRNIDRLGAVSTQLRTIPTVELNSAGAIVSGINKCNQSVVAEIFPYKESIRLMKEAAPHVSQAGSVAEPEAAVAIIRCRFPRESILLLRRIQSERDPWSGHYAFPGGRRERQDETIYDTCVREVFEETGIDLGPDNLSQILPPARAGRNVMAPVLVQPYVFEIGIRPEVLVEEKEIESYLWL